MFVFFTLRCIVKAVQDDTSSKPIRYWLHNAVHDDLYFVPAVMHIVLGINRTTRKPYASPILQISIIHTFSTQSLFFSPLISKNITCFVL